MNSDDESGGGGSLLSEEGGSSSITGEEIHLYHDDFEPASQEEEEDEDEDEDEDDDEGEENLKLSQYSERDKRDFLMNGHYAKVPSVESASESSSASGTTTNSESLSMLSTRTSNGLDGDNRQPVPVVIKPPTMPMALKRNYSMESTASSTTATTATTAAVSLTNGTRKTEKTKNGVSVRDGAKSVMQNGAAKNGSSGVVSFKRSNSRDKNGSSSSSSSAKSLSLIHI